MFPLSTVPDQKSGTGDASEALIHIEPVKVFHAIIPDPEIKPPGIAEAVGFGEHAKRTLFPG